MEEFEFRNLGEQLMAVANGTDRERLLAVEKRAAVAPAGASELEPSTGGFLVAPEFSRDLVKRAYNTGQVLRRCTEIPLKSSNTLKFPQIDETSRATGSRLGGVQCWWLNESQNVQIPAGFHSDKPKFKQTELTTKKVIGLLYLTDELAMDTDAFNAWANYALSQELLFTVENAIVNGTGAGQPRGINGSNAQVIVAKQGSQGVGTVVGLNAIDMRKSLWAPSRENAIWLYNQDTLDSLMTLTLTVGTGGSQANLWQSAYGPGMPDMLCGIPAYPSEYCQAPGTPGDLILADFSRFAVAIRESRGDVSIHVGFDHDIRAFRFVIRMDGEPLDGVPMTPLYGTTKTSPFVALAAR